MAAQHDKELMVQEQQHRKDQAIVHLKELFKQVDTDGSGEISADEMEHFLSEPTLNCYIDALGITAENTRTLFYLMDIDQSGKIDLAEFCDGCLRLQGEARSTDVHTLIYQVRQFLVKWADFAEYCEDRFQTLSIVLGNHSQFGDRMTAKGARGNWREHKEHIGLWSEASEPLVQT